MPVNKKAVLEIVLGAKNLTAGPFNKVIASLKRMKAAGIAAVSAVTARLKGLALQLAALAGPAAILGSIRFGAQFEKDLAKVGTLGSEARSMLEEFRAELEKIAVSTGTPLDDLTEALFNMISAGVPAATAIKTLGEANKLAVAGSASLAQSTFALTKVLSAYSLSADDARSVAEKLFATQVIGQTTLQEVANNFAKVTSVAASLNVPLDQLATAFGDITKSASNTEEAATSLRQSLVVLQKPPTDLKNIMDRLGLTLENLFDDGRTLGDVWASITDEASKLGVNMALVTGNVRAFTAVAALGANNGLRFATALDTFRQATKELDVSFDLLNSTTASTISILKEFIKIISARFAAPFMKQLNKEVEITGTELKKSSIQAEIFGLQVLKIAKHLEPVIKGFQLLYHLISLPIKAAFNLGSAIGNVFGLIVNTVANGGKVFKQLAYTIKAAMKDLSSLVTPLLETLKAGLKSVGSKVLEFLLEPFRLVLLGIKETIKAVTLLGFKIANIFNDAKPPEDLGEIPALEKAYKSLTKLQDDLGANTEDLEAAWGSFTNKAAQGSGNLSNNLKALRAEAIKLADDVAIGSEWFEKLTRSGTVFVDDLKLGVLNLTRSMRGFFGSMQELTSGELVAREVQEIKNLYKELREVKSETELLSRTTNPLWQEMVLSAEAYAKSIRNGFDATLALNTLVLKVPDVDTSSIESAGEVLKEKAIKIWDTLKIYGEGLNNLYGQAKVNEIKTAWGNLANVFTSLFNVTPLKDKMSEWVMSVEELGDAFIRIQQGSLARFFDSVAAGTARTKDLWKNMLTSMLSALNKFLADRLVLQLLAGFGFGPLTGGSVNVSPEAAAKGAVWQGGFTPFEKFATGGIVTKPTLGLIGEAGQNEAVVPLPNGKSIPVEMTSSSSSDTFNINIQALDGASVQKLLLSDSGQKAIVSAFRNARATRRGFQ